MAGIITSVADDIKKLEELKKAIAGVKGELKGIDITVDVDIKGSLEKQLRSLTEQYNGVAEKISQAEGRIILSVQNINKATESIVQAQHNIAQSAQNNTNTPSVSVNVEAQAKSYDELRERIESINGTREQLIEQMVREMNEIRLLNAEIKRVNKEQEANGTMTQGMKNKLVYLNNELLTHKTALSEVRQALNNNAKLDNAAATSMNGLSQSLSQMRIVYRGLTEEERSSPFGQQLLVSIQQADAKIKELDASIGNHQRNVGNYISAFDGFKDIKSADELKNKFQEANIAIEETEKSIQNLSQASSEYASKGKELSNEIGVLSAAFRQASQQGLSADEQLQSIENIKTKIQEYGTVMVESSAAAQAAYDLQKEKVISLETELTNLQAALQTALNEGNTASGDVLAQQILRISKELEIAQSELVNLSSAANEAKVSLSQVAEEQAKMSQGVSPDNSFIGSIIDLAKIAKEELKDFLKPATEAVSTFAESVKEKATEAGQVISGVFSNLSQRIGLDRLGESFNSVGGKISEYTSRIADAATGNGKFQQSLSSFKEGLNQLPIPLGNAINGVVAMTKSLWSMVATPVGAVLAAIVLSLQALFQWFTKDAEGQRVFAKGSAYLGSLLSSLTDIVVTIGKYLYHAFADAGAPLNSFTKGLKTTFVSAVKTVSELVGGLGNTLKGIFTFDWDTFKNGVSQMGNGLLNAGKTMVSSVETAIKGVVGSVKLVYNALTDDDLAKNISKHWDDAIPKAQKSAELAERETNARIAGQKAQEKAAKLDEEIARKREEIYTLTGKAKDAAIEETKALMKAKYDDQIKVQKEQLDILKTKNSLHTSSLEDLAKERDLNIQLLRTQAQREASTRMMTRMQQSNLNKMSTAAKRDVSRQNSKNTADTKWEEVLRKSANERLKVELSLEDQATEARIKAMEDGAEKVRAERERENEKELEQIKKQRDAAIEAERNRQKAEFDAEQTAIKSRGGKTEKWDESKIDETFINKIKEKYEKIFNDIRKAQQNDLMKAELTAIRDYLKEYGTVQQQKYAIAKEYDEKIAKSSNEAQKRLLERQKQEALSSVASKDAMMSIDWQETFGNMGTVLQSIAKETLAKVDTYMKSNDFKALEAKDKEAYANLRSNLRSSVNKDNANVFSTKMWDDISTYAEKYKNSVKALQDATKKHEKAIEDLKKAEKDLSKATTDEAKKIAKEKVESIKKEVNDTAAEVDNRQQKVTDSRENLNDSAEKAAASLQNFQTMLSNITSGSLTGFSKGVGQLINSIAGGSTKVGDAMQGLGGKIGGLVGAILSIIEALGDDPAGFIDDLIKKIVSAVENILTNLDDIAFSIVKGVGNLAGGIIKATLSGATFGLYNAKGNVDEMNKRIEELKAANETLAKSIEELAESISDNDSTNKESVEAYKKAIAAQEESNANQREAIRSEASKYSNSGHGFMGMGGRSSFNVYANDNRINWLSQFNEALRKNGYNTVLNDVSQVWNLTAEQLKAIRSNAPKAWAAFFNSGGEGNPKELVEEFIDNAAGALDELTDKLNEKLTGYSWSGFKQSYESLLLDLESTTDDFADNISEIINKALVNSFINSPEMQKRIKNLYDYISDAASDGVITKNESEAIRRKNDEIANYGIQWRQAMEEAGIMQKKSSSGEATGSINAAKGIKDDTANELVGRITAVQLTEERLAAGQQQQFVALTQIGGNISAMANQVSGIRNIADETRSILANSYIELQQINENTREVVKPIKLMQGDIAEMKRKL